MDFNNLKKTFKYINDDGQEIILNYKNGFLINKPFGIDSVGIEYNKAQGINQIGEIIQGKKILPKPISITGRIVGQRTEYLKELMVSVFRPDIKGKLYADDFFLNVVMTTTPNIEPYAEFPHFSMNLLAPFPYWQKEKQITEVIGGLKYSFKFPRNFSKPWRYGELMKEKYIDIENTSQIPVPFKIIFKAKGTCKQLKIINIETMKKLQLNKEMKAGEIIEVNISHEGINITSNFDGDIQGTLALDSDLFELDVGHNRLKPEIEFGGEKLEISIEYSEEKAGIVL